MTPATLTTAHEWLRECPASQCPVCRKDFSCQEEDTAWLYTPEPDAEPDEIHHAAHCCLWKDHDHAARVRIAERVEAGANWAEAIEGETL